MNCKVLKPFSFRGNLYQPGAVIALPDERINYFTSDGLVEVLNEGRSQESQKEPEPTAKDSNADAPPKKKVARRARRKS